MSMLLRRRGLISKKSLPQPVQLVFNGNFADRTGWWENGATFSVANNEISVLTNTAGKGVYNGGSKFSTIQNHKHLVTADFYTSVATAKLRLWAIGGYMSKYTVGTKTGWQTISNIIVSDTRTDAYLAFFDTRTSDWTEFKVRNAMCIDLTETYGAGNEPTTVEQFLADYPDAYYPYNPT